MLRDRGLLVQNGVRYVVTGDVTALEVPETLQALVASRLDNLDQAERSLLQDASVSRPGVHGAAATQAVSRGQPFLDRLVGKQVLSRDDDHRSPERGQYVFLQALVRTVAYGTLSRKAQRSDTSWRRVILRDTWPGEARDAGVAWPRTTWRRSEQTGGRGCGRAARIGLRDARGRWTGSLLRSPSGQAQLLRARRRACRHRSATSRTARRRRPRVARQR